MAVQNFELETADGRRLFTRFWRPDQPRAVFLVVHGLGEHSGWYDRFAQAMAKRQLAVFAYDQQGHGLSPGSRGTIASFDQLLDDLRTADEAVAERAPDLPIIVLGHSMGGNVVLKCLLEEGGVRRPAVLSNPMILPTDPPTRPQIFAAWLTGKLIPWLRVHAPVDPEELTHDDQVLRDLLHDPLVHNDMSLRLGTQLLSNGQWILDHSEQLETPLLMLVGDDDTLCDHEAIHNFAIANPHHVTLHSFPGMLHSLLVEKQRVEVYARITQWLEHHL